MLQLEYKKLPKLKEVVNIFDKIVKENITSKNGKREVEKNDLLSAEKIVSFWEHRNLNIKEAT